MTSIKKPDFQVFLKSFPEIELPITLTELLHHDFSKVNDPIQFQNIEAFILPLLEEVDEFTEFVPLFKIPTPDFHAIVFWQARLLEYDYVLATYNKKGVNLDSKAIAGTLIEKGSIFRVVATIERDWMIYTIQGKERIEGEPYDATSSVVKNFELLAAGEIIEEL